MMKKTIGCEGQLIAEQFTLAFNFYAVATAEQVAQGHSLSIKRLFSFIALLLSLLASSAHVYAAAQSSIPSGPFFGQKPPGLTPEPFAPGIVNTPYREGNISITPDLQEIYLVRKGGQYENWTLVMFKQENSVWRESAVMPRIGRPILSADGNTMHLGKKYMERTKKGWSKVKNLGPEFDAIRIMRLASTLDGSYVFDEVGSRDGDGVLRYSRIVKGKREAPKVYGNEINTGLFTAHPYVAPDGSYVIWDTQRPDGFGEQDLYVSFRLADGSWSEGANLGDKINSGLSESAAYVTPDGKYLFYSRNMNADNYDNADVFWVDAQVVFKLRPE